MPSTPLPENDEKNYIGAQAKLYVIDEMVVFDSSNLNDFSVFVKTVLIPKPKSKLKDDGIITYLHFPHGITWKDLQ